MISERMLKKWRKEALHHSEIQRGAESGGVLGSATESISYISKVLRLTQELLDQHLLNKEKKQ
jgi:hypothetical protein